MITALVALAAFVIGAMATRARQDRTDRVVTFIRELSSHVLQTDDERKENRLVWEACAWLVQTERGKALLASLSRTSVMPLAAPPKSAETLAHYAGRTSVITQIVMQGLKKIATDQDQKKEPNDG